MRKIEKRYTNGKLDHYFTGSTLCNYENPSKTIIDNKLLFNSVHTAFQGDLEVLEKLRNTLLGEAYVRAYKVYNEEEETNGIPTMKCFKIELYNLVQEYIEDGWKLGEEWREAINNLKNKK